MTTDEIGRGLTTQDVARAGAWSGAARFGVQATNLVSMIVLAHLLSPEDFGVVAMAMAVVGFLMLFTELGIRPSIVRQPTLTVAVLDTGFWINVLTGVALAVVIALLAPLIALAYGEPRVSDVVRVLGLNVALSVGAVPLALYERRLQLRRIAFIEVLAAVLGAGAGITVAIAGGQEWSLVVQVLASTSLTSAMLLATADWRPHAKFDRHIAKDLWGFSLRVTLYGAVNFWARAFDNVIIGRVSGSSALGLYSRAYSLMLFPVSAASQVVGRIALPVLVRVPEGETKEKIYLQMLALVAFASTPAFIILGVFAPTIVRVVFGPQWTDAAPLVRALAVAGMAQAPIAIAGALYQALGRAGAMLVWGVVATAITWVGIVVGVIWDGAHGVAVLYAVTSVLLAPVALYVMARVAGFSAVRMIATPGAEIVAGLASAGFGRVLVWLGVPWALGALVASGLYIGSRRATALFTWRLVSSLWRGTGISVPGAGTVTQGTNAGVPPTE